MSINIKELKKQKRKKKKRVRTWKQVLRLGKQDCDLKMGGKGGGLTYATRVLGARKAYMIIDSSNTLFFA